MKSAPSVFRVALEVGDLVKTGKMYERLLGVKGRAVGGGRFYFDCGPVILAVIDVAAGGETPEPAPENVYFAVGNLAALHARAKRLGWLSKEDVHGQSGGAVATRPWGEKSFYVVDPFGNRLCFVDRRTLFKGRSGRSGRGSRRG